jgi:hypothetical protein
MSTEFSHSLRSLQAGRSRLSLATLLLAALLLIGWLAWFFFAPVTLYESGEIVQTSGDGVVVAQFPLTAQTRIQLGQVAEIFLEDVEQTGAIPAIVADVTQPATGDQFQVMLYADMDSPNVAALQSGLTGRATVAVEHLSPATLVMRAAGQGIDTPPVSFSPQE